MINAQHSLWLPGINDKPGSATLLRLFCFPYAGGGSAVFREWANYLPPEVEVCPVQFPGRESRLTEPLFTRIEPLVQKLSEVLQSYLDVSFAFFGHSMGALVSFELARQLRRQNNPLPKHLFVSGHRAPSLPDTEPPFHQMPEIEFVRRLRSLNGTPEAILSNAEMMQLMLPVLRADFAICETYTYVPEEKLDCSLSAFGGSRDSRAGYTQLAAWKDQISGDFALYMFPGDHFFLQSVKPAILQNITRKIYQLL